MQPSTGLLLAASWMAATPLFSFPQEMKMQTNPSFSVIKLIPIHPDED